MPGLNAGIANTWFDQYTSQPTPCITDVTSTGASGGSSTLGSCIVWLIVGVVLGSITFEKKGHQQ